MFRPILKKMCFKEHPIAQPVLCCSAVCRSTFESPAVLPFLVLSFNSWYSSHFWPWANNGRAVWLATFSKILIFLTSGVCGKLWIHIPWTSLEPQMRHFKICFAADHEVPLWLRQEITTWDWSSFITVLPPQRLAVATRESCVACAQGISRRELPLFWPGIKQNQSDKMLAYFYHFKNLQNHLGVS